MKSNKIRIIILSLFISIMHLILFSIATAETSSSIPEIKTDEELTSYLENNEDSLIVLFHSPMCGHCKNFMPEFDKLSETLKTDYPNLIKAVKVNCADASQLCMVKGIQGYPTVKFIKKDIDYDYNDQRSEEKIRELFKLFNQYQLKKIKKDEISKIQNKKYVILHTTDIELENVFKTECQALLTITCYITEDSSDLLQFYQPEYEEPISYVYKLENKVEDFKQNLKKFLIIAKLPILGFLDHTAATYFEQNLPILFLLLDNDQFKNKEKVDEYTKILKKYRKYIDPSKTILSLLLNSETHKAHKDYFGISDDIQNTAIILNGRNKYLLQKELTLKYLEEFVDNFLEGTQEIFYKSQIETEDMKIKNQEKGVVMELVGSTINSFIHNSNLPVFILFYSVEVGNKQLQKQIQDMLAEIIKQNSQHLFIGKLDIIKNDIKIYDVVRVPTLVLFQKDKEPITYNFETGHTKASIIEFLQKEIPEVLLEEDKEEDKELEL